MARGVNKVMIIEAYTAGKSLPQVASEYGISVSTARYHVAKAGVLRSRTEGILAAAREGRLGAAFRGKKRVFSSQHREEISRARLTHAEQHAAGTTTRPNGYVRFTRGKNKSRSVHVVIMEKRLGRTLRKDEVVHHIDGNPSNNSEDNLALCTRAGHTRLHRREDELQGIQRKRNENGTWS